MQTGNTLRCFIKEIELGTDHSTKYQAHEMKKKAGLLQANYKISEYTTHITNKNMSTIRANIDDEQPCQQDFRYSSDILSSEISIEDSAICNVDSVSPVEWNIEDVVVWLETVGLDMVIDNFIGIIMGKTYLQL